MSLVETTRPRNGQIKDGLPADRKAAVEHGIAVYQEVAAERDRLKTQLDDMNRELAAAKVEVAALKSLSAMLENRIAMCMHDRDQAVGERGVYEALFISIQAQLRGFQIPAAPLITKADDATTE